MTSEIKSSPETVFIRNPETRLRMNPDTYLRFDGTDKVYIQNVHCMEGVSIKYDILLILYELVEWKTTAELIEPWPPDDQEKILDYMEMFYKDKIIITSEGEVEESESGLSEHLGSRVIIDVENHHNMLRDTVRTMTYREAIRRNVNSESVVMDLGAGSGVLSFFAAQSGAKKVYAIEKRADIVYMANALSQVNGFDKQVEFIEGMSSMIKETRIDPKPDILVAEILGNGILEENVLEFTIDARNRFLKPGGRLIPMGLDIHVFAFDSGVYPNKEQEIKEVSDLYNIDFSLLGKVMLSKTTVATRYFDMKDKTMSDPVMVKNVDFTTLQTTSFSDPFELAMKDDGNITGFCAYFKAHLDEKTTLTNSPWAPLTHWTQLIYYLPEAVPVKKGDTLKMECVYDGALRIRFRKDDA